MKPLRRTWLLRWWIALPYLLHYGCGLRQSLTIADGIIEMANYCRAHEIHADRNWLVGKVEEKS